MYPIRRQVSPQAARLRREQTDVEERFWFAVRDRRLGGFKFRRQHSFDPFVADFVCIEATLVVELDGGQHNARRDASRTQRLMERGYRVIRFWNSDVTENMDGVLTIILAVLNEQIEKKNKKTLTLPSPANAGEG